LRSLRPRSSMKITYTATTAQAAVSPYDTNSNSLELNGFPLNLIGVCHAAK
jgi:hypothetical protein